MKIDIIIAYLKSYEFGHEKDFVTPITGIHLAAGRVASITQKPVQENILIALCCNTYF